MRPGPGLFVTFEGIDGSGKTTQIARLAAHLRASGRTVRTTREPGGSPGAESIRALLVEGEPGRWSPETEILLFAAARRDHIERVILPALAAGETVLCDRFADSTRAYQSLERPDLRPAIESVHATFAGIEPDLTLILDIDADLAASRGARRGGAETRFEQRGVAFQRHLRAAFQALARENPNRCRLIAADGDPDTVATRIAAAFAGIAA